MRKIPEAKPLFLKRMKSLLEKDFDNYMEILKREPVRSIRTNTLKISPEKLKEKLEKKNWIIKQPFKEYPEIMIVENNLNPGELGRALEHLIGYYYIQELASMLPIIALKPKANETILDLCSSPGSKTTQMASFMNNSGTIIANEVSLGRIKILASNLERCGVTNTIITKKDGIVLCKKLKEENLQFDKILVDAPCSGEGTLRSTPKTYLMWNIKTIKSVSRIQKNLVSSALDILKPKGELIYSTCTHAPEENEEVIDFIMKKFNNIKIEKITLPVKSRKGLEKWQDKEYLEEIKDACRIYPQDNDTEGFFLVKFKKLK
ncbi:MAG: RsmB/NOP family class I SAM-dependent RNA methyltransferase [Candidatus Pacearchaeota archaeon]|jgi:NOL1/NOP2/sun family putative RNA methylase|nr:tRNA methyltransferase [Candidatus Pacearchaeota archaeon]MDP7520845.1 RsmB/NOP family class I SAM-dependent RNA methyltransferase [Candidatus Pacearchaeota archaeon]|tara:strand:+ start:165 stop:1121 length:957 start_codon:yes stop_codon:yes gene_type:complete